jgi:hypothetical protein
MQKECAAKLRQNMCQKKNLQTKSILAAHLPQIVHKKYAAGVCRKVAANCVPEKKLHTKSKLAAHLQQKYAARLYQKCSGNSVPEKKIAYEKYTCGKLVATNCSTLAAKKQVRFLPSSGLQKSVRSLGYPNHGIRITDVHKIHSV